MGKTTFKLPSYAKTNWFLRVLGRREDGYHEICTVFQTLSLCDYLTFSEDDKLNLTSTSAELPTDDRNLVIRAAKALAREYDVKVGAAIHLEKHIPFPGGLGGGSSNAAIALIGLAKLWSLPVKTKDLVSLGAGIGADVPFFFWGGTALGNGTGTEISGVKNIEEKHMLLVTPDIDISTEKAYKNLALRRLTKNDSKSILQICCDDAERLQSGRFEFFNDFEKSVFALIPEIEIVKKRLLKTGAKKALLSGSGSSVFGVFDNEETRRKAVLSFKNQEGIKTFPVETISRRKYLEALEPCIDLLSQEF